MAVKKTVGLSVAEKNKVYKLYKFNHLTKKELAASFNCSIFVIKALIANFDSPLQQHRLHAKKSGTEEPVQFANERWKTVTYPTRTRYEVSNLGRVRSYFQNPNTPVISRGVLQMGYLFLDYFNTEERRRIKVSFHTLVADHFVTKQGLNHNRVIHLDYKKANNRASNLKWVTQEQFVIHLNNNPALETSRAVVNANRTKGSKLTLTQVERIRKMLADPKRKTTKERIAAMYNIAPMTLYRIQRGEIWGDKGNPIPYEKKEVVKLPNKTVAEIKKKLSKKNAVQSVIAAEYGLSPTIVNRIKKGLTYKTV